METHAHHLHNAPGKNFWHYFFEFFMLFIAVFCGFLAENFREHQVEKDREKVYIRNLYEDLKSDTAIYSAYTKSTNEFLSRIDSLFMFMKSPERKAHLNRIYFLARTATMRTTSIHPNDRTFDQMKHAGLLRLISYQQVADSVSSYYNSLNLLPSQSEVIRERSSDYMAEMGKIFDAEILFRILKEGKEPSLGTLRLLTDDPLEINQLLAKAQYYYGSCKIQTNYVRIRTNHARILIELIKKEYHLE